MGITIRDIPREVRCGDCAHCKTLQEVRVLFGAFTAKVPDDWVVCIAPIVKPKCLSDDTNIFERDSANGAIKLETRYITRKTLMRDCKLFHRNVCIKCGTLWSRIPTTRATEDSLMRILAESMAKILEANPHQWFSQPCESCMIISNLLGRPFGCEKKMRDTFGG